MNRVGDRRGRGHVGMLANALRLVRPGAVLAAFHQHSLELWNIEDIRNLVFAEIGRGDFALIVDQLFHQARTDRHDRLAVDLSLMAQRIDDRADVMGADEFIQLHSPRLRIDFYLRHLGDKRSRRAFARYLRFNADRHRCAARFDDVTQTERPAFLSVGGEFSVFVDDLIFTAVEQLRRLGVELLPQLGAGLKRYGAVNVRRAAAAETDVDAIGNIRRVADVAAYILVRHLHLGGDGLAQNGLQPRPLIARDRKYGKCAVGFGGQIHPRFTRAGAALIHRHATADVGPLGRLPARRIERGL